MRVPKFFAAVHVDQARRRSRAAYAPMHLPSFVPLAGSMVSRATAEAVREPADETSGHRLLGLGLLVRVVVAGDPAATPWRGCRILRGSGKLTATSGLRARRASRRLAPPRYRQRRTGPGCREAVDLVFVGSHQCRVLGTGSSTGRRPCRNPAHDRLARTTHRAR